MLHLDWLFVDWEFGYRIREWDRRNSKEDILKRMKIIQSINTSKNTFGYHWVTARTIGETIDAVLETGAKKYHSWISVSPFKQTKRGGHVPFQYSHQFVSVYHFWIVSRSSWRRESSRCNDINRFRTRGFLSSIPIWLLPVKLRKVYLNNSHWFCRSA